MFFSNVIRFKRHVVSIASGCSGVIGAEGTVLICGLSMHHIYAESKIEAIESAARSSSLTGLYLLGKPGRVVVEGRPEDVRTYVSMICRMRWQKCAVMCSYEMLGPRRFNNFVEVVNEAELDARLQAAGLGMVSSDLKRGFKAAKMK